MKAKITLVDGVLVKTEGTAVEIANLISALRRSHPIRQMDDAAPAISVQSNAIIDEVDPEGFASPGDDDDDVIDIADLLERKRHGGRLETEAGFSVSGDNADPPSLTNIPESTVKVLSNQFRVVADPTRLHILSTLADSGRNVGEICEALGGQSQPAVSQHLALLRISGLVTPSREGPPNIYELTNLGRTMTDAIDRFDTSDACQVGDLFRQVAHPTRLQILLLLSERRAKHERALHRSGRSKPARRQRTSGQDAPDLIESRREGMFIYSSLRETGEELIRVIGSLLEATGQDDPSRSENPSETGDAGLSKLSDEWPDDISDARENEG